LQNGQHPVVAAFVAALAAVLNKATNIAAYAITFVLIAWSFHEHAAVHPPTQER
jgi:hypothetical protein